MSNKPTEEREKILDKVPQIVINWATKKNDQELDIKKEIEGIAVETEKHIHSAHEYIEEHSNAEHNDITHNKIVETVNLKEEILGYQTKIFFRSKGDSDTVKEIHQDDKHPKDRFYKIGEFDEEIHRLRIDITGFGGCHSLIKSNPMYTKYLSQINQGRYDSFWLDGADGGDRKTAVLNVHESRYYEISIEFVSYSALSIYYFYIVFRTYHNKERTHKDKEVKVRSGRIYIHNDHPFIARIESSFKTVKVNSEAEIDAYDNDDGIRMRGSTGDVGGKESIGVSDPVFFKDNFPVSRPQLSRQVQTFMRPPMGGSAATSNAKGYSNFFKDVNGLSKYKYKLNIQDEEHAIDNLYLALKDLLLEKRSDRKYSIFWVQIQSWVTAHNGYIYYDPSTTDYNIWTNNQLSDDTKKIDFDNAALPSSVSSLRHGLINSDEDVRIRNMKKLCNYGKYIFQYNNENGNNWGQGVFSFIDGHPNTRNILNYQSSHVQPIGAGCGGVPHKFLENDKVTDMSYGGDASIEIYTLH